MASPPLRWGVIGCGWVGHDLAGPAIQACDDAVLVAVCDPSPQRRNAAADRFASATPYADAEALLADPLVEAVYVATPNDSHPSIVRAAAAAGRHVLCEKPMAVSSVDAADMLAACRAAGVRYGTAFDQRHHPAHRALTRLVADGALGDVTLVRVHYACWLGVDWSPWDGSSDRPAGPTDNWRIDGARAGGGALVDLAPHSIDLLPLVVGAPWQALVALEQHRVHGYEVADGAVLAGRLGDGVLASIDVSYNCPEGLPRRRLEVFGTRAMAEAVDTMGQDPGGRLTLVDGATGRRDDVALPPPRPHDPFLAQIEAFGRHVRDGEPLLVDPSIDVAHVEWLERVGDREPAWR